MEIAVVVSSIVLSAAIVVLALRFRKIEIEVRFRHELDLPTTFHVKHERVDAYIPFEDGHPEPSDGEKADARDARRKSPRRARDHIVDGELS